MSIDLKAVFQSIIIGLLTAVGLFCSFLLLSYSWVKILAIVAILIPGAIWLLTHGQVRKAFKFISVAALIFAISFTGFEGYMLLHAGYPATTAAAEPGTTISFPSMLNISLTKLIQGIENSPTYALLTAEHGKTTPEAIKLDSDFGWIEVDFYGESSNTFLGFMASSGNQYHVQVSTYQPFSLSYGQESSQQAFTQIDALGLQSFYNSALAIAQNKTGATPGVDSLSLTINFGDYGSYEGITLLLVGSHRENSTLISGSSQEASKLIAEFEPNGTLLYMSQPQ